MYLYRFEFESVWRNDTYLRKFILWNKYTLIISSHPTFKYTYFLLLVFFFVFLEKTKLYYLPKLAQSMKMSDLNF